MRLMPIICLMLIGVIALSGCKTVVQCPADELRMFGWQSDPDNNRVVSLSFSGSDCMLDIRSDSFDLSLSGLCVVTDDTLTVCDEDSGLNYTFGYKLFSDRVELTFSGGTVSLDKQ